MAVAISTHARGPTIVKRRRWRIPPPPLEDGRAPGPEGLSILSEVDGPLGVVLWKSLRAVRLWSETNADSLDKLFDAEASERRYEEILEAVPSDESELRAALEDLLPVLASPSSVESEYVAQACARVATWANSRGSSRTELEFLQAAAACRPDEVEFALAIGRIARDLAQYARAEAWLYRAVGLARVAGAWPSYVTAYLRHGIMMYRRGALPAARRSLLKALRRSRRQGLRDGQARALHNLANLEYRAGAFGLALEHAAGALAAYGPRDERLPRLAHDIAYYWLEQGYYEHSFPVFMETLSKVETADRPVVLGSFGRAAAGLGDEAAYRWALAELRECAPGPGVAEAWVDMARAASSLGRHEEAREAAKLAESVARSRREGQMAFLAEEVMNQLSEESEAPQRSEERQDLVQQSDRLARDLLRTLQQVPRVRATVA